MAERHPLIRWTVFNLVGALGMCVQLGVLGVLVRGLGWNYLWATGVAVEAAVLHNFAWHQRWTWRDRPSASPRGLVIRLGRFHVLNGMVSLLGNLALMAGLVGLLGLDPLLANLLAVTACSAVNFTAGTTLVFRAAPAVGTVLLAGSASLAAAGGPGGEALQAWKAYERTVERRYSAAGTAGTLFFLQDAGDGASGWRAAVLRGEVTISALEAPGAGGAKIHHWVGAVLVPGVTLQQVLDRLQAQAGTEARLYEDVLASRLLSRDGSRLTLFMKLRRRAVLTATYNTEHAVEYRSLAARRASSRSVATRIAELADAGTPAEREKPIGSDNGFLWRLNAYWRYEETTGGVLIECESVSLSRGVLALARPVVSPLVNQVARESLARTLRGVRAAVSQPGRDARHGW